MFDKYDHQYVDHRYFWYGKTGKVRGHFDHLQTSPFFSSKVVKRAVTAVFRLGSECAPKLWKIELKVVEVR